MSLIIRVLLVALILVSSSRAANYVVVRYADSGPGTLRQAILNANTRGGGTITFSNVTGTINLVSPLPVLTANITILGPGLSELAIACSNCFTPSLLTNSADNVATLSGLTIRANLDNFGTFVVLDSLLQSRMNPGHAAVYNSGTMTLSGCTFTGNFVPFNADSIENAGTMNLDNCSVINNRSDGGSILNRGTLIMDKSVVSGHSYFTSSSGGIVNDGGIVQLRDCTVSNNISVEGGGVWNGGFLAVTNCTINGNVATYSDPTTIGGGIYNIGYAILQNTTLSGNSAQGAGGGVWNGGVLRFLNCTITSNTVSSGLGGGVWNSTNEVTIFQSRNSIVAGNSSHNGSCSSCTDDIRGFFETFGHNIILSSNGWTRVGFDNSDLIGVNPKLGPLQNNGGPTRTHALLPGSPAIDAGDPVGAPSEDERGVPRPQGPGVDIGAFEYQYPVFTFVQVQSKTNLLLKASVSPSTSYALQASQDLISWNNIATLNSTSNGVLQVTNFIVGPKRFFRLKSQTP